MEPRFENRYYSRYNMMTEFGRKYAIGPSVPAMIGFWILYLFLLIPILLRPESFSNGLRTTLLILGPVMLVNSFLPQIYGFTTLRNAKKLNDGVQPEVVITFGDTIELREGMIHITVEYHKILRVIHLKHSYMLMIGKRNGVMLDPDGFTTGTFPEFKEFLREKRPDLQIPE